MNHRGILSKCVCGFLAFLLAFVQSIPPAFSAFAASPVVSITSPADKSTSTAGSNVTITATATETGGTIASVSFYNGKILLGTSTKSPYSVTVNSIAAGTYNLTAKAIDARNVSTTSCVLTITVLAPPTVSITSPLNNAVFTLPSNIVINAVATPASGTSISKVAFYNGTILLGTATKSPYTYTWSNEPAGSYTLTAVATQSNNLTATSSKILITVNPYIAPPIVNLTSPANKSTFTSGSNVTITATATETGGTIASVSFYNGTALLGTSTKSPYSITVNNIAAGTYNLTAKAIDARNVSTTSCVVTITVLAPPTVSITSPLNNAVFTVPSNIVITATAAPASCTTISKVAFYNGTTLLGTVTKSPYTYTLSNAPVGSYTLTVVATQSNNLTSTSSKVVINVVNSHVAPTISLTSPANNTSLTQPTNIVLTTTAIATNATISKVDFYNGTTLLKTVTTSPYTFTLSDAATGTYSFKAVATDSTGATGTSTVITATVNPHIAPTVSITSPANDTSYTAPTNIALTAIASATNATISQVAFYNGTTLLGTATSSPYTYTWSNVVPGIYNITAQATDSTGAVTTSLAVSLTVLQPAPTVSLTTDNTSYASPANVILTANPSAIYGSISQVEFFNGTTLIGTVTSSPYKYTWTNVGVGTYSLTAEAFNNGAVSASIPVSIKVNPHAAPTVSITSPANNASYTAPTNITLTAIASATNATISQVSFYNGTTLLGTTTSSPYTYTWNNVVAGSYNITAQATDSTGAAATSTIITITVANASTTNGPPIASAGPNQKIDVSSTTPLDGSKSSDPQGYPLTYNWSIISKPTNSSTASLSNATIVNPIFKPDIDGIYTIQLIVNDGYNNSQPSTMTVTAGVLLSAPSVPVPPGGLVAWWPGDGNANDIVGGHNGIWEGPTTYVQGQVGQAFNFNNSNYVSVPSFSSWALGDNDFTIDLWVNFNTINFRDPFISHDDGSGAQKKWIFWYDAQGDGPTFGGPALRFHINAPDIGPLDPIAVPWNPQVGQWYHVAVTRSGSTYSLYIDGKLVQTQQDLNQIETSSNAVNIGFAEGYTHDGSIDEVEAYGRALSADEILTIYTVGAAGKKARQIPPIAIPSPNQNVMIGDVVTLDASKSYDPNSLPLNDQWQLLSKPANSSAELSNPDSASSTTFIADQTGQYVFQLTVNNGSTTSAPEFVTITAFTVLPPPLPPVAITGVNQNTIQGNSVTLSGLASYDPEGNPLTYQWSILSEPLNSTASLSDITSSQPTFTADQPGEYDFQLIVNDGTLNSTPAFVSVFSVGQNYNNLPPIASAGVNETVDQGRLVILNGSDSFDIAHTFSYQWSMVSQPAGSTAQLIDPTSVYPFFTLDAPGSYVVQLIVNNGVENSLPSKIVITTTGSGSVPFLTSITPASGQQGTNNLSVSIGAQNTHFVQGTTQISFGPGITTGAVTVNSPTSLTVLINIDPAAATGTQTVAVTTGTEAVSLSNAFTVTGSFLPPVLTAVSPNSAQQGLSGSVSVTGQNTNFVQGTTQLNFGPGITVNSVNVISSIGLTAQISIDPNATVGPYTVTATTGSETAQLTNGFTVNTQTPAILSMVPASGLQGQSITLTITAQNTHWVQGTTAVDLGNGVTISNITVLSSTNLTVQALLDPSATLGSRSLTITTGTEIVSGPNIFNVTSSTSPSIIQVSPDIGQQGQQNLTINITGQFTNFVQGTSQVSIGSNITVNSVTVTDATHLAAQISLGTSAAVGPQTLTVTTGTEVASLPNGFIVQASGVPVNQPPVVTLGANPTNIINIGDTTQIQVRATDDVGITSLTVTVNGNPVTLQSDPQDGTVQEANFSSSTPGIYNVLATAIDAAGNQAQASMNITVLNPADNQSPTVDIATPVNSATLPLSATFTGTVSDTNLVNYTLAYAPAGQTNFTTFATGTTNVINGTLGTLDTSILQNGFYDIQLTATNLNGFYSSTTNRYSVQSNLKIGQFSFSQQDLVIPADGLPLSVIRTYNSLNPNQGDFGISWTYAIQDMNVQLDEYRAETTDLAGNAFSERTASNRDISLTLPDGTRTTFTFSLVYQEGIGLPGLATYKQLAIWTPPPGVFDTLVPTVSNELDTIQSTGLTISYWLADSQIETGESDSYDFPSFILTTKDGTKYLLTRDDLGTHELSGDGFSSVLTVHAYGAMHLTKITDTNNNQVEISSTGISNVNPQNVVTKSVVFQRDSQNRITSIFDPNSLDSNGNPVGPAAVTYIYDAAGNLSKVNRLVSGGSSPVYQTTTYLYQNPNFPHYITSIQNPDGTTPIENVYDNQGRLIGVIDANGKETKLVNDVSGNTETVYDRLGNQTIYTYDDRGNVLTTVDALGFTTQRQYDANNDLTSEIDTVGNSTTYTYDANGNKTSQTDPLNNVTNYTYNSMGQILTQTDPLGHVTQNTYDANGNLLTTQDPLGNTTNNTYDSSGNLLTTTDALGNLTTNAYDGSGHLIQQTDALGHITTYTYDSNGNKISQTKTRTTTSGTQTLLTQYAYDSQNRLIQTTYPDGSTTQTAYNDIGKQSLTTDQLGRQTTFAYDETGNLITTTYPDATTEQLTYDADGRRSTSIDKEGRVTSYQYDAEGHLTTTTYPDNNTTTTRYDSDGRVVTTRDALGNAASYQYDAASHRTAVVDALNHITQFTFDADGNQASMTDAKNNTTSYQYDANNRQTTVIFPDSTQQITAYDALGRSIVKTDQAGKQTQYLYDSLGRLNKVVDALGKITTYTYDEVGNQITQTDANNHTTTFAYDSLGRRIKRTLPLGMSETNQYDAAGNQVQKTDFNGKTTTYTYDIMNRTVQETPDPSFSSVPITFTYTPTDQRASMTDPSGTTTYTYDNRDRLLTKATPEGTLTYTYDAQGNLLSINSSNPNGTSVNYTYDTLNRLSTVKDNSLPVSSGVLSGNNISTYFYDQVGNVINYVYPNNKTTTIVYDTLNRLTQLSITSLPLASYVYTLGPTGNRLSVTDAVSGRVVNYTYDNDYRLTKEAISNDPNTINGVISYTYDAVGNRLSRSSTVSPVPNQTITYDANDRLSTDGYDANGSTTTSGTNTYSYDFENHLITSNAGGGMSIVYDGDGNRVSKTVGGTTTKYLIDDLNPTGYAQVLEELSGGTVQKLYTYGLSRISQSQGGAWSFYEYDGMGNVRFLTDIYGGIPDYYDYDAFGNSLHTTGTTPNTYGYAGEDYDQNLNLIYLRARFMQPSTGRFWTSDSFEGGLFDPSSLHKYLYASANPVNMNDPSGNFSLADTDTALIMVGILAIMTIPYIQNIATILAKEAQRIDENKTPAVIGQTVARIAKYINNNSPQQYLTFIVPDWVTSLNQNFYALYAANVVWIFKMMAETRRIYNIGFDPVKLTKGIRSPFYEMELAATSIYPGLIDDNQP